MSKIKPGYARPLDFRHGRVDMTHGSGGRAMAQLIDELFVAAFDNEFLRQMNEHGRAHDTDPDEADIWFLCHLSDSVFQKKYRQNETKVDVKSIHT